MNIKQIEQEITNQQKVINKATARMNIYIDMRGLCYKLREVDTGKKIAVKAAPKKTPPVPKVHKEVAKGLREIAAAGKKKKPKKLRKAKKNPKNVKKPAVTPFVHEAMGYMPKRFTSTDLLEITLNCVKVAGSAATVKQVKSGVHSYLYAAASGKFKNNPHPLGYTGSKDAKKCMIYEKK